MYLQKNVSKEVEYFLYWVMRSVTIVLKTKFQHLSYPLLWVAVIIEKNNKRENLKDNNTLKNKINVSLDQKVNKNTK